jgi:[ribosomal protein S5]-alanine N-acetyltransferase
MVDESKINGDGFVLVPFNLNMITDEYLSWLKTDAVNKYLLKPNKEIQRADALTYCKELIESKNNLFFAINILPDNKHIGNVRLGPIDHISKVCKYSMMIGNTDYHGKGLGTKIVSACISFVFDKMKMRKFYLDVISGNIAAIRTYEKNGLIEEGLLKKHIFLGGLYHDLKIMSISNGNI